MKIRVGREFKEQNGRPVWEATTQEKCLAKFDIKSGRFLIAGRHVDNILRFEPDQPNMVYIISIFGKTPQSSSQILYIKSDQVKLWADLYPDFDAAKRALVIQFG